MIRGGALQLSRKDQISIARWMTLKSIVGELLDKPRAVFGPAERRWFYEHREPFTTSQVFIAQCPAEPIRGFHIRAHGWAQDLQPKPEDMQFIAQFTFMKIGPVMLLLAYEKPEQMEPLLFPKSISHRLDQIFAPQNSPVVWPPVYPLGLEHLEEFRSALRTWMGRPADPPEPEIAGKFLL
jgi:hypothetical protein